MKIRHIQVFRLHEDIGRYTVGGYRQGVTVEEWLEQEAEKGYKFNREVFFSGDLFLRVETYLPKQER